MSNQPQLPLFAIAIDATTTLFAIYEEGPLASGTGQIGFDLLDGVGCGIHDVASGTIRLQRDVETTLPDTAIVWTGRSVSVDAQGTLSSEELAVDGSTILYAAWFRTTEPSRWAESMLEMDCGAEDVPDMDEDEAYEQMMDPERRAVAMAYAS